VIGQSIRNSIRNPPSAIRNLVVAAFFMALTMPSAAQSLSYTKGQNVAPAYEGWEQGADGAKYFVFGYMNRNWEEELDIPIGPENGFSAANGSVNSDQGQPTHFLPRRNRFIFKVRVPANFTEKDELVWTLTSHGKSEKAYATLRPDYVLDDVVKASETGALGAGTSSPEVRSNKPPVLHIVEANTRNLKVGQSLTLVSEVKDDGIPKRRGAGAGAAVRATGPGGVTGDNTGALLARAASSPPVRVTVGKNVGLHVTWFLYRGPGTVTFDPPQIKAWEDTRAGANSPWAPIWIAPAIPDDGKQPVKVSFSEPGTYVLRCRADDGALVSDDEITIVVSR
jgi:hypothetical protein